MTRERVDSVNSLLQVDEKVKVLVVKSMFPDKIALRYSLCSSTTTYMFFLVSDLVFDLVRMLKSGLMND